MRREVHVDVERVVVRGEVAGSLEAGELRALVERTVAREIARESIARATPVYGTVSNAAPPLVGSPAVAHAVATGISTSIAGAAHG